MEEINKDMYKTARGFSQQVFPHSKEPVAQLERWNFFSSLAQTILFPSYEESPSMHEMLQKKKEVHAYPRNSSPVHTPQGQSSQSPSDRPVSHKLITLATVFSTKEPATPGHHFSFSLVARQQLQLGISQNPGPFIFSQVAIYKIKMK